jgi:hypothetical protein
MGGQDSSLERGCGCEMERVRGDVLAIEGDRELQQEELELNKGSVEGVLSLLWRKRSRVALQPLAGCQPTQKVLRRSDEAEERGNAACSLSLQRCR